MSRSIRAQPLQTSALFDAICDIKPRLCGLGGVANPRDTCGYRCGLRLAQTSTPSVLWVASSIEPGTSDRIQPTLRIFQALRSGFIALGCGAALLAAGGSLASGAAVEPDRPVSAPGLGNGGRPVDPGLRQAPPRPMPLCVTAGCTVIAGPGLPTSADDRRNAGAEGGGSGGEGSGDSRLHGCPPGDPTNCTPL